MHPHPRLVLERPLAREQRELRVHDRGGPQGAGTGEDVAARELEDLQAGQVHGGPVARFDAGHGRAVHVQPARAGALAGREHLHLLAQGQAARHQGPGDHGAEPPQGEGPVQRETEQAVGGPGRQRVGQGGQRGAQGVQPEAGHRGDAQQRGAVEEGPRDELARLDLGQGLHLRVGHVALGEHHQPPRDREQAADLEVLAGLRHDRLVGRDHQHHGVDAVGPGQHVPDEPLVAGDVDEGGHGARAQVHVGEAQVDGDPPLLLLLQAVGVGAGEGPHQRALAVVDVPGGADDQGAHGPG